MKNENVILVQTCNRVELTERTLKSVDEHAVEPYRRYYLDDASTDNTIELLSDYGWEQLVAHEERQGVSTTRMEGMLNLTSLVGPDSVIVQLENDTYLSRTLDFDVIQDILGYVDILRLFGRVKGPGHRAKRGAYPWHPVTIAGENLELTHIKYSHHPTAITLRNALKFIINAGEYVNEKDLMKLNLFQVVAHPVDSNWTIHDGERTENKIR